MMPDPSDGCTLGEIVNEVPATAIGTIRRQFFRGLSQHATRPVSSLSPECLELMAPLIDWLQHEDQEVYLRQSYLLWRHHSDTFEHNIMTAFYGVHVANNAPLDLDVEAIGRGGYLHDNGKLFVSQELLDKPGKPTREEWEQIFAHPEYSHTLALLGDVDRIAGDIVRHHHVWWDGSGRGYPAVDRDQVTEETWLMGVVDSYDAMTMDRPYREEGKMPPERALYFLKRDAGTHYDPIWVAHLMKSLHPEQFENPRLEHPDLERNRAEQEVNANLFGSMIAQLEDLTECPKKEYGQQLFDEYFTDNNYAPLRVI